MLCNKRFTKIRSFFLAAILSISTITGPLTTAASAATAISYYSGTKDNSGSQGKLISTQLRDTAIVFKKDILKDADEVIKDQSGEGVNNVIDLQNEGYLISGWKITNRKGKATTYDIGDNVSSVDSGYSLTAIAQWAKKANITINGNPVESEKTSVPNGSVSLSSFPIAQGKDLIVYFDPKPGYDIKTFTVNGVDKKSDITQIPIIDLAGYKIPATSVGENVAITVSFAKSHSISTTVIGTHGTVDPYYKLSLTNPEKVFEGEDITFTLKPKEGYQLDTLLDNYKDVTSEVIDNEYTLTNISEDHALTISYKTIVEHTLTIEASTGVTTNPTAGNITVLDGSTKLIRINTADKYRLTSIKINGEEIDATEFGIAKTTGLLTVRSIKEDTTVSIIAEEDKYSIHTNVSALGNHGTITESGSVFSGENFEITVTPDAHYELYSLILSDDSLGIYNRKNVTEKVVNGKYTIENITKDIYATATFAKITDEYTLTVNSSEDVNVYHGLEVLIGKSLPTTYTQPAGYDDTEYFTIVPKEGYEITSLKINGESQEINKDGGTITVNITGDTTIDITSKIKTFNIIATSTNLLRGIVTPALKLNVKYGESYTLNIVPYYGYELDKLTLDGLIDLTPFVKDNTYTDNKVTADALYTVSFKKKVYTITVDAGENVTTDPAGPTISAEYLDTKTITLTPNEGYSITSISINGKKLNAIELAAVKLTGKLALPLIGENKDIVIKSKKNIYNINTAVLGGHGTITKDAKVEHGNSFTAKLNPAAGYELASLTVNGKDVTSDVEDNSYTISAVTSDTVIIATYKRIEYSVNTKVLGEGGKITNSKIVKHGDDFLIKVTPNNYYKVDAFTVDGKPAKLVAGYYLLNNITSDHEVEVSFKLVSHDVRVYGSKGTIITPNYAKIEHGNDADFTVKAIHNYEIQNIYINGKKYTGTLEDDTLHLENISRDTNVMIYAKKVAHDITTKVFGGHGTVSDGDNVADGESFTVTATPDEGYKVKAIYVNGRKVKFKDNSYTIKSVKRDTFIAVTFTEYLPAITLITSDGVSINTEVPAEVTYGSDLSIEIIAKLGYYLDSIKVNGEKVELPLDKDILVLSNITEDTTIEISAKAILAPDTGEYTQIKEGATPFTLSTIVIAAMAVTIAFIKKAKNQR